MSSNTNTLFWVITGAVIVLAIFGLVTVSNNSTLNRVFNSFDNYVDLQNGTVGGNGLVFEYQSGDLSIEVNPLNNDRIYYKITNTSNHKLSNVLAIKLSMYDAESRNLIMTSTINVGRDINSNSSITGTLYLWNDLELLSKEYVYELKVSQAKRPVYNCKGEMVSKVKDLGEWELSVTKIDSDQLDFKLINKSDSIQSFSKIDVYMYKNGYEEMHLELGSFDENFAPGDSFAWGSFFGRDIRFDESNYDFNVIFN